MIYFDFTSSACWGGNPVGIIRVERGLFSALSEALPGAIAPVIYHQKLKHFFEIRPDVWALFRDGGATLGMDVEMTSHLETLLAQPPEARLDWTYLFEESARECQARASAAAADLQEDWRRHVITTPDGARRFWIPFFSAVSRVVRPFVGDTVVSAGLDWDNKDLVAITALKEQRGFRYVQCIYDLVPVQTPQFVVPEIRKRITRFFNEAAGVGDAFVCISHRTETDWRSWRHAVGGPSTRAVTFPLSTRIEAPAGEDVPSDVVPGLRDRAYALYVSTIEPRKNHRTLYLAWKRAIADGRVDPDRHALLFIGMKGWLSGDLVQAIEADRSLQGSIVFGANVSDTQLASLVRNCAFTLFPSFYEGFGLGLGEALAMGKFGISSTEGALPEVGGDFVDYLDPDDVLAWSRSIAHYLTDAAALEARERQVRAYRAADWRDAVQPLLQTGVLL